MSRRPSTEPEEAGDETEEQRLSGPLPRAPGPMTVSSVPPPRHDELAVAAAVHEIQNVLASVLGWVQLARDQQDAALVARAVGIVERGVRRASEMVGTLADPEGRFRVRDTVFDARLVLTEVFDLLEARCRAAGVTLRVLSSRALVPPSALLARGDPGSVAQILTNLVINAANAVSAAGREGLVELSATSHPAEGRVTFTVRDNGPGMDGPTLARLFDPSFTTSGADYDGPRGTGKGLGMAVSRSLAEAMSARLEVASEPGRGTEATLSLRKAPRPSEPALVAPSSLGETRLPLGLRVLVVDDEPAIRELLEVALSLRGARVTAVGDVRTARKMLSRGSLDVAIIDEGLGGDESGALFLAEMSVAWPGVGRVLMTGAASIDHVTAVPCAAFVRKPFLLDDVVRALLVAREAPAHA